MNLFSIVPVVRRWRRWQRGWLLTIPFVLFFALPVHASDTLQVVFTGDILLDRGVRQRIERFGIHSLFSSGIDSVFHTADYVVGNLECPVTTIRQPNFKKYIFRGDPEWLPVLREHGVTHLNMANNHTIDQGRQGLLDTKRNVEAAGIIPVGAGSNMTEAVQPVLISNTPRPVYLLTSLQLSLENFSYLPERPCVSQESIDSLGLRISRLRQQIPNACIVVSLHWGVEHTKKPVTLQRQQARMLIDAGADILICHHTHTLQSIEKYHGKFIYYSIGNFIFDSRTPLDNRACMVKLRISASDMQVETLPVEIRHCVPFLKTF